MRKPKVRYFIFVVLHEVVHAVKKHKTLKFDDLTRQENKAQEDEADKIAMGWFNEHVKARNNQYLKPITMDEINKMDQKNQVLMANLYTGCE